jgi:hypothetical protein
MDNFKEEIEGLKKEIERLNAVFVSLHDLFRYEPDWAKGERMAMELILKEIEK